MYTLAPTTMNSNRRKGVCHPVYLKFPAYLGLLVVSRVLIYHQAVNAARRC